MGKANVRSEVFEEWKSLSPRHEITWCDDKYLWVNCNKHGRTKRTYGWKLDLFLTDPCEFCWQSSTLKPSTLLERKSVAHTANFIHEGYRFSYLLEDQKILLERVDGTRRYLTDEAKAVGAYNVQIYSDFRLKKKAAAEAAGYLYTEFVKLSEIEVLLKSFGSEPKVLTPAAPLELFDNLASGEESATFHCEVGHKVSKAKARCRICSNREALCGFNDIGCLKPELLDEWRSSDVDPHATVFGSNKVIDWECAEGHKWSAMLKSRFNGSGCSKCAALRFSGSNNWQKSGAKLLKDEAPELAATLVEQSLVGTLSYGSHEVVEWRCKLGHIFELSPNRRVRRGCYFCNGRQLLPGFNDLISYAPELAAELVSPADGFLLFRHKELIAWAHETEDGIRHEWMQSPERRVLSGYGCTLCAGTSVQAGVNDVGTTHPEIAAQWSEDNDVKPTEVTRGSGARINFICPAGHEWSSKLKNATSGKKSCVDCRERRNHFRSAGEDQLLAFIEEEFPELSVEINVRRFKSKGLYELDLYIESLKLAIEFNGIYWHQEQFKGVGYHAAKRAAAEEQELMLLEVWEDAWSSDRESLKEQLREVLSGGEPAAELLGRSDFS